MTRSRSAVVWSLLAMFAVPATASAAVDDRKAFRVAERTWGVPPCGQPTVESRTPEQYQQAHGTGYFESNPLAWADESRCVIVINSDLARLAIRTAAKRCHVIVHEWGHLAGREHSTNPRSVMYEGDNVTEGRVRVVRAGWQWKAAGAFKLCY